MCRHEFLWEIEDIENSDISTLQEIIKDNNIGLTTHFKKLKAYYHGENIPENSLHFSIDFLSELLKEYYHKKVMVLVDDFDKPVISAIPSMIEKLCNKDTWEEAQNYLLEIAVKTTEIISPVVKGCTSRIVQVILTGIFNTIDKTSSACIIHEMSINNVSCFGFNDKNIEYIFDKLFKKRLVVNYW